MIKNQRKKINLTQKQFARFIGVSERCVQKWEKGETKPYESVILLLAVMIDRGLTVDDVIKLRKELRQ